MSAKRAYLRAALQAVDGAKDHRIRSVQEGDRDGLGALLFEAYLGTIDQEEETLDQAHAEVDKTLAGVYGVFDRAASQVLVEDGRLASAVLVTTFDGRPFVAFTLTTPAFKGRGLARACLAAAMAELARRGERELRLVVTLANEPAVRLYRRLGFEPET